MKAIQSVLTIAGLAGILMFTPLVLAGDAEGHDEADYKAHWKTHCKKAWVAAPFALPDHEGKEVKLSDYEGKIVVLEWLNYDCPFIKWAYDAKITKNLAEKYAPQGVVWLAINSTYDATIEGNKAWVTQHALPYPILLDKDGKVGKCYWAKTTPYVFVINTKGKIVYRGALDNAPLGKTPEGEAYMNYVDRALGELAAGKDVTIIKTKSYGCPVKYEEKPAKDKPDVAPAVEPAKEA